MIFERFANNVDRFVMMFDIFVLLFDIFVLLFDIFVMICLTVLLTYIFAPLKSLFWCRAQFSFAVMLSMHILMLFDAIIIVKSIFIFKLKIPTVVQDDFWKLFVNLWIIILNILTQIIFNLMPGINVIKHIMPLASTSLQV